MVNRKCRNTAQAALGLGVTLISACGSPTSFNELRDDEPYNVLLVTLDTLRADRIGPYGFTEVETPTLDSLAATGVTFERAYSPTPLTLPSHSSLMTGTYPVFHGVRDNGAFVIPDELPTLPRLFRDAGFQTSAFVAAFVLDSRWGLSDGFDTYRDDFVLPKEQVVGLGAVQHLAEDVVDKALGWFAERETSQPFFSWVHLYDPHTPYTPPEPYRSRYEGRPYLGEIAYTDAQLGRLLDGLDASTRARTIIVVAADHGEGLGDHDEIEHGFFIYEESIRIPLIISTPFSEIQGLRRNELVSLVDLMPTILEMSRLEIPDTVQADSLSPLLGPDEVPWRDIVYAESYYPRLHFGWSELRSVRTDTHKFISASEPEIYDLAADPGELNDIARSANTVFADLNARLEELYAGHAEGATQNASMELDEETRARLAALGYLSTTVADLESDENLPDPREKIGIYNDLLRAKQLKLRGNPDEAVTVLEGILEDDDGVIDAHVTLATLYSARQQHGAAIDTLETALGHKPGDLSLVLLLVGENVKLRRFERALEVIADFEDMLPEDPRLYFTRGNLHRYTGDLEAAITDYERSLEINPDAASAWAALAGVRVQARQFDTALAAADRALGIDEAIGDAHFVRGQMLQRSGNLRGAETEYLRELEISPQHLRAAYNLATIYRELGQEPAEERYLRRALEINPDFPLTHLYLARLYMRHNQNLDTAIRMTEWARNQDLADRDLAFAHFLLADLYNRTGDAARSQENLQRGQAIQARLMGDAR